MLKADEIAKAGCGPKNSFDDPMEHLLACHRKIEQRLDSLLLVAANMEAKPEEARDALKAAFKYFDTNGHWHTEDEEVSIFPRIAGQLNDEERAFVAQLEAQHKRAEASYSQLKAAVGSLDENLRSVIGQFNEAYREHIATEESQLITIGRKYLTANQMAMISAEMKQRRGLD